MTPTQNSLFVAGGSGFIGTRFIQQAVTAGYSVIGLCRSAKSAASVRQLGAEPVLGDLLLPGPWQQRAAEADIVIHIAQPPTFGGKVTKARAEHYRQERLLMDRHILQPLSGAQRIVYVSGTSYYGDLGPEMRDETATPRPMGFGPYVVEALAQVRRFHEAGLPIVETFPGGVYGAGSWYGELVTLLRRGSPLYTLPGRPRFNSYVHVDDCAAALLHLCQYGRAGERYFVVDDVPATLVDLAALTADRLGIKLRRQPVPHFLLRAIGGLVIADSMRYENRLSNAKLRVTGFTPRFPSYRDGLPSVLAELIG
jgi:hypothetical protein